MIKLPIHHVKLMPLPGDKVMYDCPRCHRVEIISRGDDGKTIHDIQDPGKPLYLGDGEWTYYGHVGEM